MYRWSVYYTLYGKKCKGGRTQLEYMRRAWLLPWENLRRWSSRSEYYHNQNNDEKNDEDDHHHHHFHFHHRKSVKPHELAANEETTKRLITRLPSPPFTTTFYLVTPLWQNFRLLLLLQKTFYLVTTLWPNFQPFLLFQPINFLVSDTTVDHCQTF